jgi:hypothetical protein
MNQLHLTTEFDQTADHIQIELNENTVFEGLAFGGSIDIQPKNGVNRLRVHLIEKAPGNFVYSPMENMVKYDSNVIVNEIIIQHRYFRSLLHKCGKVVVNLKKNPGFTQPEIIGTNILTMAESYYEIEFEYPVKFWMQRMLHSRDLTLPIECFNFIKPLL